MYFYTPVAMMNRILILIIFVCLTEWATAQTYNFRHYTVEDGLLHEFINDMIQDRRGDVWIATGGGLSRFNGYDFVNYTTRQGLNSPRLQCVAEDQQGNIWAGSAKGINVYNGKNILSLNHRDIGQNVLALEQAGGFGMWVLTERGVSVVLLHEDTFYVKLLPFNLGEYNGANIFQQRDLGCFILNTASGGTLVGFSGRLYRISGKQMTRIILPENIQVFSGCEMRRHEILLGTDRGLFQMDGSILRPVSSRNLGHSSVFKIRSHNNKIWVIARSDDKEETWLGAVKTYSDEYFRKIEKKNGLINPPTSLFIDHENNVWCSSYGGLSILRGETFISYNRKNGLGINKVWGVGNEGSQRIWVGSIGEGLAVISYDTLIRHYTLSDGLPDMSVGKIFPESPGRVLLGTANAGLCFAEEDFKTGNIRFGQIKTSMNIGKTRVDDLVRDHEGTLWIATSRGLFYSNAAETYIHYPLFQGDTGQVFVQKIHIAGDKRLWVVTKTNGIFVFENGKFSAYQPDFFRGVTLSSMTQDCAQRLWVGSQTHGICDISEDTLHWIGEKDGLVSGLVYILLADGNCNLWIGTNLGLDKIVLDDYHKSRRLEIRHYDINDGMQSLEMNLNGATIDDKENIWFASNNGLLKYNYLEDIINNIPPISHITDVQLFSKPAEWPLYSDSVNRWTRLPVNPVLPYDQNHITFLFVGISFRNQKKISYSWILEGFDARWTPPNTNRSAIYSNLPPGQYTFRLRSSNNEGLWTPGEEIFRFEITPPFWETWWFRIPAMVILLILLYGSYRWRTLALRRSKAELENQVRERTAEIRKQKEKIESIHHVVEQSIEYAQQIQRSTLPSDSILKKAFDGHFVLYQPRDKVSGDFYWWTKMKLDNIYVIAVADCTGHGVPGAFMSMLGMTMLNEIVNKEYFFHPPVILRKLRKDIIASLKQSDEFGEVKDGMDMAIVCLDLDQMTLQFAGANNPLYLISEEKNRFPDVQGVRVYEAGDRVLYEFLPDKMPISIFDRMNKFTGYEAPVKKGDILYIFSDGFADQFGGPSGRKFMYKSFKNLLIEVSRIDIKNQETALKEALKQWMGKLDQVDDITVMGIKM